MHIHTISSKNNSIGFLRFFLAILVVVSHCYPLGNFGSEPLNLFTHELETFGSIAVAGFFFISGFLITRSYTISSSLGRFLWHRCLRILPGFWFCLLVTAFLFGPIVYLTEYGNLNEYIQFRTHVDNPIHYIKNNFLLRIHQYTIDGLLSKVPFPGAFDGALWTLIHEFKCYVAVAFLGCTGILKNKKLFVLVIFIVLWIMHIVLGSSYNYFLLPFNGLLKYVYENDRRILEQFMYFFAGATFFIYKDAILLSTKMFLLFLLFMPIILFYYNFNLIFLPLVLPYILIWLSFKLPLTSFDKQGDFSYGMYIYAFPIQQILSLFGLNRYGLALYFSLSIVLTMPLAILSWRYIEKPCLQLKNLTITSAIAYIRNTLFQRWKNN